MQRRNFSQEVSFGWLDVSKTLSSFCCCGALLCGEDKLGPSRQINKSSTTLSTTFINNFFPHILTNQILAVVDENCPSDGTSFQVHQQLLSTTFHSCYETVPFFPVFSIITEKHTAHQLECWSNYCMISIYFIVIHKHYGSLLDWQF